MNTFFALKLPKILGYLSMSKNYLIVLIALDIISKVNNLGLEPVHLPIELNHKLTGYIILVPFFKMVINIEG